MCHVMKSVGSPIKPEVSTILFTFNFAERLRFAIANIDSMCVCMSATK